MYQNQDYHEFLETRMDKGLSLQLNEPNEPNEPNFDHWYKWFFILCFQNIEKGTCFTCFVWVYMSDKRKLKRNDDVVNDKMSLIDDLSDVIYRSFDKKLLRDAYQQARFGDRLYGYQECILSACAQCFREYMGDVYYFHF